jgi:hypothetical protein
MIEEEQKQKQKKLENISKINLIKFTFLDKYQLRMMIQIYQCQMDVSSSYESKKDELFL